MYTSFAQRRRARRVRLLLLALAALLLAGCLLLLPRVQGDLSRQSAASAEAAVRRAVVQCYAVEGAYPADLQYLEERYGLQINHRRYIVDYNILAPNVAPQITVLEKES
ncbi:MULTISPECIES: hypothetical protein [Eubacteriales]|uniref:Uncharacterized protein n=1 Tax=Bittarella massiliensis (ex Durand et al. 2017) TaxID=1720313 RepID=A0AAQ1MG28_9FIRM|nr:MULTISPECIES: hypothetical protein [Eubacteriales]ERI99618.1 hypothetical protein HMPREF0262_01649 [Clostridium sp. ATCC 29733]SHG63804.1 hypothetical protein SAMN05444424_2888 [Bittarella massiliensis (ex Durand et al. 2017)]